VDSGIQLNLAHEKHVDTPISLSPPSMAELITRHSRRAELYLLSSN